MNITKLRNIVQYNPKTGYFYNKKGTKVGTVNKGGYVVKRIEGQLYYLHRLAWLLSFGEIPNGWSVDHIDQNHQNNKLSNLRCVPHKSNLRNQKKRITNTSGVTGVYSQGNRWRARIKVDGKFLHLGIYKKKEDAIRARLQAEATYGFHSNHGK